MGDAVGAYRLMAAEVKKGTPSLVVAMSGYFSMLVGKIDEAKSFLTDSRISGRDTAIAHSLLSQIYLAQNNKEQALSEAAAALRANADSPMARMTAGLVKIAYFDLPEATKLLERSLSADPRFLEAYVYLARLWLGSDYLDRAWEIIGKAMEISKTDSEVLSLAGFIRLGYRDFHKASALFTEAVKNDPGFGEPHIGLANIAFRNRNFGLGLTEMLTATLLEPRVSLYQSSLGKALYQTRSFDKALEVYDYAKTLDPNDPTPYLYKGIALSDLYRPGEAIQEINKSIELNDNMAVFRSRLALDRDLAVRNTDLSRAYNQLGMSDWAYSKALTAVKKDPLNPSAHLFLSSQFLNTGSRTDAGLAEFLMYRLLAPANESTFTGETYTYAKDYTPMFEMPYARVEASAGIGTWTDHPAPIQDHFIEVYGGWPGLALDAYGLYANDPGFRRINDNSGQFLGSVEGKFEPTIKDSFYAAYSYDKARSGDNTYPDDFYFQNDPYWRSRSNSNSVESGYVHRFSPEAVFIGYFNWGNTVDVNTDYIVYPYYFDNMYWHDSEDFNNVQLQQRLKLGDHTLIGGFDYFTGSLDYFYHEWYSFTYGPPPINITKSYLETPDRATSVYVRDYWRICPNLIAELGISGDFISSSRSGYPASISSSTANPLVGLNYEIDKSNTLRFAYLSYVNDHSFFTGSLAPSEVAGFPSMVNAAGFDGSKVKELGFAWESQWNPLTFTVFRLTAYRVDDPQFVEYPYEFDWRLEHFDGLFTVNRLLTSSLGLSAGVAGKIVSMRAPMGVPSEIFATGNFNEISGNIALSYMHPSGWFASIRDTVVHQDLGGLSDPGDPSLAQHQKQLGEPFNLVDITFGKYFANKRGSVSLAITNIFNQHFCYEPELLAIEQFYPGREILFRLTLFF
jgi:tetratricopeptide (TPR) repeat protein